MSKIKATTETLKGVIEELIARRWALDCGDFDAAVDLTVWAEEALVSIANALEFGPAQVKVHYNYTCSQNQLDWAGKVVPGERRSWTDSCYHDANALIEHMNRMGRSAGADERMDFQVNKITQVTETTYDVTEEFARYGLTNLKPEA